MQCLRLKDRRDTTIHTGIGSFRFPKAGIKKRWSWKWEETTRVVGSVSAFFSSSYQRNHPSTGRHKQLTDHDGVRVVGKATTVSLPMYCRCYRCCCCCCLHQVSFPGTSCKFRRRKQRGGKDVSQMLLPFEVLRLLVRYWNLL